MSSAQQALAIGRPLTSGGRRPWRPIRLGGLQGSEFAWAVAFVMPYVAVFLGFVVYPVGYGLWMGSQPQLYAELAADTLYWRTVVNTLLFIGIGVNLKLFLAFLLSGFFLGQSRWTKGLLLLYLLPWALPALPAFLAFHWMLIGHWGFLNSLLSALFDIEGPVWFNSYWLALGSNIVAYIWKWLPFWTLIFLAGRMAIPRDVYEAAEIDGATPLQGFLHVTVPLLANLYLICTLLSTAWTLGDFTTVYFVSGGAPALSTEVLATFGFRDAFTVGDPRLGVAAVMSALPLLIPIVVVLMRKVQMREVQL
jgi:multiple sugar transport system permease protein